MNKALWAFFLCILVGSPFWVSCHSKSPEEEKIEALKVKAAQFFQEMAKLEAELKKAGSDEGKQNFLQHDIEMMKSRILRLKEEAKSLNGGKEISLEPPPAEGGGGHH
ncbi:MAG: hypothetical protein EBQ85_00745 [Proteobacteria bacterium]|nr:hypothetical protein [Pseudomonadota bacterium]